MSKRQKLLVLVAVTAFALALSSNAWAPNVGGYRTTHHSH
jgi:hypothetical protein